MYLLYPNEASTESKLSNNVAGILLYFNIAGQIMIFKNINFHTIFLDEQSVLI